MPKFSDIKTISQAPYRIDMSWDYLEYWIEYHGEGMKVDMDPPYQRGYVWTERQKISYCEYILKRGMSGRDIFWNCPGWMRGWEGPIELVDGKQRVSSVLGFLHDEIPVFGHYYSEYEDRMRLHIASFSWYVNDLKNPLDVVQWYIDMNTGGSVHTEKDLEPAYKLLAELKSR